jgi:drug/metabolite transporter (DMT)-like permease
VLGHSSFNWALGRLKATYVAGTVLGEALGSTVLAWIVLKETPPEGALVGGALVLLGIAVFLGSEGGR